MTSKEIKRKIRIGTISLDAVSFGDLLAILDELADDPRTDYVVFCEAHLCVRAAREPEVRNVVEQATLVLPDGVAMTAGARLIGERFPDRLPGPSVMVEYCKYGLKNRRKHFFYGGDKGVAERLAQRFREMIPGIEIVGVYSPPFRTLSPMEEDDIRERIESSGADVLWVGLGAPKQECWMAAHQKKIKVPLMLGVGAAFDFHSGTRRWAPAWIRKIGMEWFYRMLTGGRRVFIRNLKYESAFTWLILKQVARKMFGSNKTPC